MAMTIGIVVRLLAQQRVVASVLLLGLVGFVVFVFASERDGAPAAAVGSARLLSGEMLNAEDRAKIGATTLPAVAISYLLPEHSKTLLIGDAKPFYYRIERISYQTTWDRGVLSRLMREYPDEPAQWAVQLRELGFTHCLIDKEMLRRWEQARWNDPLLTAERVANFVESYARVVFRYSDDLALYELIPTR
jgi:hypothetical protein